MDFALSPLSPGDSPETPASRRDRAAIAAQACQTCRSRKSKCDERRPKCGLCTRLNIQCVYREPQPTKWVANPPSTCPPLTIFYRKDKTLVHILQVLERVESKVDRISSSAPTTPALKKDSSHSSNSRDPPEERSTNATSLSGDQNDMDVNYHPHVPPESYLPVDPINSTTHLTASHRILLWPSVYLTLNAVQHSFCVDLAQILQDGSPWFIALELRKHGRPLPGPSVNNLSSDISHSQPSRLAGLTPEAVRSLAEAYFDTFNMLHPILDHDLFFKEVITPILRNGLEEDTSTNCLALTVLALGQVAIEGVAGSSVSLNADISGGIRGGSVNEPPGLTIFNEARRKFITVMNSCSLENVQIYLLQATYFEACARHMDYWRSCSSAAMAFQVLIRCEKLDWSTTHGDLIKRAYWTCILNEDLYHLELDLPRTGIYALEDQIPLPTFTDSNNSSGSDTPASSHIRFHFIAMIGLRRLITRIHSALHSDSDVKGESSQGYDGPPIHLVKELARQLESWRTFLPQELQWSDNAMHGQSSVNPLSRVQPGPLFSTEEGGNLTFQSRNLDIVTANLRTRFYHARYLIYRPFIFKALHFPEAMTSHDEAYCALAIRSACMWPIAMYPCKTKKRLLPHLFTWTQNFVGILIILRMTYEKEKLKKICEEQVNPDDIRRTVALLLDWIRDLTCIDALSEWSWGMLASLYQGFD